MTTNSKGFPRSGGGREIELRSQLLITLPLHAQRNSRMSVSVALEKYTAILWDCIILSSIKIKLQWNSKLLSTDATFGFVSFANCLIILLQRIFH